MMHMAKLDFHHRWVLWRYFLLPLCLRHHRKTKHTSLNGQTKQNTLEHNISITQAKLLHIAGEGLLPLLIMLCGQAGRKNPC